MEINYQTLSCFLTRNVFKLRQNSNVTCIFAIRSFENKQSNNLWGLRKYASRQQTLADRYVVLQQNHPEFTKEDFLNEILTFMVAGSDSVKITIASCLLTIAAHPDIQDRLYQEIVSVTGSDDKDVTVEDINKMQYMDQVLKETLRKYSVTPFITRTVDADLQLSECVVPAGATVGISLLSLHFDPVVFPDPEKFDPDRFSPENAVEISKYSYMPFSSGSRSCIGKRYANLLAKTILVNVLKKYRLTTDVDTRRLRYSFSLVLYVAGGYPLELHHRSP